MPNKTLRGEDSSEVIELYESLEEALTITREEFLSAKKTAEESTLAMEWFLDEYNIERIK